MPVTPTHTCLQLLHTVLYIWFIDISQMANGVSQHLNYLFLHFWCSSGSECHQWDAVEVIFQCRDVLEGISKEK